MVQMSLCNRRGEVLSELYEGVGFDVSFGRRKRLLGQYERGAGRNCWTGNGKMVSMYSEERITCTINDPIESHEDWIQIQALQYPTSGNKRSPSKGIDTCLQPENRLGANLPIPPHPAYAIGHPKLYAKSAQSKKA